MTLLEAIGPGVAVLALGCVLLLWGAEEFMEHLGALAAVSGIPVLALGLLLAGAEPEELATALIASSQGHPVLAATDAIGANVTMLTLGLGLAFLVQPVTVSPVLRRYALLASLAGVLALAALADGHVGRWEAATLCLAYVAVVVGVWRLQRRPPAFGEVAELLVEEDEDRESGSSAASGGWRAARRPVLMVLVGLAAMVAGGALAVDGASRLAQASGLGEHATGLSALAFATSAEVLALVAAARKRSLTEVAVGGVLGSAIYNATLTLGASAYAGELLAPDLVPAAAIGAALPLLVLLAVWRPLARPLGGVLVVGYVAYIAAVLLGRI